MNNNTVNRSELPNQNLRFRQGGRVYLRGEYYQMDGTDGQGRLMLLPSRVYRAFRGSNCLEPSYSEYAFVE